MKRKLAAIFRFSRTTRILLAVFIVLVICVAFMGLDNAPGIATGWAATLALLAAWTYRWRKVWYFLILSAASFVGAILLSFLHEEVVYPLTRWVGGPGALESPALGTYHQITTLIILFFGPMGILGGIAGAIVLLSIRLKTLLRRKETAQNT